MKNYKEIPGLENYLINKNGKIKKITGIYIKTTGNIYVALSKEKQRKTFLIGTLVSEVFNLKNHNKEGYRLINLDSDKTNNKLSNLKWISRKKYNKKFPGPLKGKTYREIYGTEHPKCGFQRGENNVAKRPEVREKIINKLRDFKYKMMRKIHIDEDGNKYRSSFEVDVKNHLVKLGLKFDYKKHYENKIKIKDKIFIPDFLFKASEITKKHPKRNRKILIEITGSVFPEWRKKFIEKIDYIVEHDKEKKYFIIIVTYPRIYHYYCFLNQKYGSERVHVFSFGDPEIENNCRTLVNKKITNIDYTHFLPWHERSCSQLHGHSSEIELKITGFFGLELEPWLIDFSKIKKIVKKAVNCIDHKLIINTTSSKIKYSKDKKYINIKTITKKGNYEIKAPSKTVTLLNFDTTAENLSFYIAEKIAILLPSSIFRVEVTLDEGINNAAKAIYQKQIPEIKNIFTKEFKKIVKFHASY